MSSLAASAPNCLVRGSTRKVQSSGGPLMTWKAPAVGLREARSSPVVDDIAVGLVVGGLVRPMHRDALVLVPKPSLPKRSVGLLTPEVHSGGDDRGARGHGEVLTRVDEHRQRRHSLDRPDKLAHKGSPEIRDKRGIQASLATGGTQARRDDRVTRVRRAIRDRRANPDDRVTRVIREIQDKKAIPAIEASPLHAPTDSIAILILTTEG